MSTRTHWFSKDLSIKDEPLAKSLIEYRQKKNRARATEKGQSSNLVSSITDDGKQMPIIDMDFPHKMMRSSTDGHSHLYIDVSMSKTKWFFLMWGLWQAGVIELGYFIWSIRRGGNFVRTPYTRKKLNSDETTKPTYGWFFKIRDKNEKP